MIHFITYGDEKYEKAKQRILQEAKELEIFDSVKGFGPEDLKIKNAAPLFYKIMKDKIGGGYWLWKPVIIKQDLDTLPENDILVYADAGCILKKSGLSRFQEYINIVKNIKPILRFQTLYPEITCTTNLVLRFFNAEKETGITDTGQYIGGVQILRKCKETVEMINLWYEAATKYPVIFTDTILPDPHPSFELGRRDQSVFSVITKLYLHHVYTLTDETWPDKPEFPIFAARKAD